jgi:hypothetical protein
VLTAIVAAFAILTTWIFMAALLAGLGLAMHWAFSPRKIGTSDVLTSCWMGIALCVLVLQLWHFAMPIGYGVFALVALMAVAGLAINLRMLRHWLTGVLDERRWLLGLAIALLWLANHAAGQVFSFDTGLYHLPAVRWSQAYAIVPGLGNLHGRFAFNSSGLLYHALFDIGPWRGRAEHLTNGFLAALLLAQALSGMRRLTRPDLSPNDVGPAVFDLLAAPLVVDWAMWWELSSFSTDVPAAAMLIAGCSRLFALLARPTDAPEERAYRPVVVVAVFSLALVLKLSTAVVAGLGILVALWAWRRDTAARPRHGPMSNSAW